MDKHTIVKIPGKAAKIVLIAIIIILALSILLGTIHLGYLFYTAVISPEPFNYVLDLNELFEIFGQAIILVVGYELIKSITIILESDTIPFLPILQIAIIAIANKLITLDLKHLELNTMLGLSSLLVGVGVAYFFFNRKAQ